MREIKFRARDKNTKKTISWSASDGDTGFWESVGVFSDHYDLMQFTGLKDKNGKEIFFLSVPDLVVNGMKGREM
jgi:hypothetical protein